MKSSSMILTLLSIIMCMLTAKDISCTNNENCSTKCCENSICSAIENCEMKSTIKTYVLQQQCKLSIQCSSIDKSKCCFYGKCVDSMNCFLNFELSPLMLSIVAIIIAIFLIKKVNKAVNKKMDKLKEDRVNQKVEMIKEMIKKHIEDEKKNEKEEPLPNDLVSKASARYQEKMKKMKE